MVQIVNKWAYGDVAPPASLIDVPKEEADRLIDGGMAVHPDVAVKQGMLSKADLSAMTPIRHSTEPVMPRDAQNAMDEAARKAVERASIAADAAAKKALEASVDDGKSKK